MSMIPMGGNKISINPWLMDNYPDSYLSMGLTAERLAQRYGITREQADEFSLRQPQEGAGGVQARQVRGGDCAGAGKLHHAGRKSKPQAHGDRFQGGRRAARRYSHGSARQL